MNYAIPMENDTVDTVIESTAALTASLQRVLLETQGNVQSYVANQQSISAFKQLINRKFLEQYYQLHDIERKARDSSKKLSRSQFTKLNTNDVAHEVNLKLSVRDMLQDLISIRASYKNIHAVLIDHKIVSLTSFATKRVLNKIYRSLDDSIKHTNSIALSFSKVRNYSEQEYLAFKTEELPKISAVTDDALKLGSGDMAFIFDAIDKPKARPPTPAMQRALENYAKLS